MASLLFKNPKVVLIDIPNSGGADLHGLWRKMPKTTTFGHIPQKWTKNASLAASRSPEARFAATVHQFQTG